MYCVHASGAPRTHFRAHATFPGGMPPDPPHTIHIFVFALGLTNPLGGSDYNNQTVTKFQNYASCSLSASIQTCPSFNHMGGNIWLGTKGTGRSSGSVAS